MNGFFNLAQDKWTLTHSCYWGDNNLFIDFPLGQISLTFKSRIELRKFIQFLFTGTETKEYIDSETIIEGFYIALEEEDQGERNLCFRDERLYLILNLNIETILNWAEWLNLNINNIEEYEK